MSVDAETNLTICDMTDDQNKGFLCLHRMVGPAPPRPPHPPPRSPAPRTLHKVSYPTGAGRGDHATPMFYGEASLLGTPKRAVRIARPPRANAYGPSLDNRAHGSFQSPVRCLTDAPKNTWRNGPCDTIAWSHPSFPVSMPSAPFGFLGRFSGKG